MVRNLCAYALSEPDPLQRYVELTYQQVLFEGMTQSLARERGRALAELLIAGVPVAALAEQTNLKTVPKVRKLVAAAGETERVKAAATRKGTPRKTAARKNGTGGHDAPPTVLAAPTGRRLLTDAERAALGLPAGRKRSSRSAR
jgi:hypothetical protein